MYPREPIDIAYLVATLTAEFPALDSPKLTRYLDDIVEWNDRAALVSKRTIGSALGRLVRQSAQLLYFIKRYGILSPTPDKPTVIDVGSGAGFPGVVWKHLEPELPVTLLDRRSKKVTFLERTAVVLGLEGLEIVEADAAEAAASERFRHQFSIAVSFSVG